MEQAEGGGEMSVYFHGMSYKEYLLNTPYIWTAFEELEEHSTEAAAHIGALVITIVLLISMPIWFFPVSLLVFSRYRRHFAQGHNHVFMPRRSEKNCDDCGINYLCSKSGLSKHGACKGGKAGYWAVEHEKE
jgi:hypothetical protein